MCSDSEQNKFVWSDMLHKYICWLCLVELCVDFYPRTGQDFNYFQRASELLGFDEWVCRRLYLQEVLMLKSSEAEVDAELCKRQMDAINEYLKVVNKSRTSGDINAAKIILLHKLKDRAFRCKFDELIIHHE
jgi:hypothetical protein